MRILLLLACLTTFGCQTTAPHVSTLASSEPWCENESCWSELGMPLGVRPWDHLPSRSERSGVSDLERDHVMSAADDYCVPSGLVYGVWSVESGRLEEDWHEDWHPADEMPVYGSPCVRSYRMPECRRRWQALERICRQERNGEPICDPNEVHCSRALALGPTQHLANVWSPDEGEWGDHVVDYDDDGTYDPHSLADSLASTASYLRGRYEVARTEYRMSRPNAWRWAVARYRGGNDTEEYVRKVYRYARNWCSLPGYCR